MHQIPNQIIATIVLFAVCYTFWVRVPFEEICDFTRAVLSIFPPWFPIIRLGFGRLLRLFCILGSTCLSFLLTWSASGRGWALSKEHASLHRRTPGCGRGVLSLCLPYLNYFPLPRYKPVNFVPCHRKARHALSLSAVPLFPIRGNDHRLVNADSNVVEVCFCKGSSPE